MIQSSHSMNVAKKKTAVSCGEQVFMKIVLTLISGNEFSKIIR